MTRFRSEAVLESKRLELLITSSDVDSEVSRRRPTVERIVHVFMSEDCRCRSRMYVGAEDSCSL